MSDELGSVVRVIEEADQGVAEFECYMAPPRFNNPLKVVDEIGVVLGTAVATHTLAGGVHLQFFLDKHTPEAFLAEVERSRVKVALNLTLNRNCYSGTVTLIGR